MKDRGTHSGFWCSIFVVLRS